MRKCDSHLSTLHDASALACCWGLLGSASTGGLRFGGGCTWTDKRAIWGSKLVPLYRTISFYSVKCSWATHTAQLLTITLSLKKPLWKKSCTAAETKNPPCSTTQFLAPSAGHLKKCNWCWTSNTYSKLFVLEKRQYQQKTTITCE